MIAPCLPNLWSCEPTTCPSNNFSIPNGQLVLRDYQKSGLGLDGSTTVTVTASPLSIATNRITPNALPEGAISSSTQNIRLVVVGVSIGIPFILTVGVVMIFFVRERRKYNALLQEKRKVNKVAEFYKGACAIAEKQRLDGQHELSSGQLAYHHEMEGHAIAEMNGGTKF